MQQTLLQPMDMGVIYTFKSHYRRFLMQSLILDVEEADSFYILARSEREVKTSKAETVK
jgi:hypothetical protein